MSIQIFFEKKRFHFSFGNCVITAQYKDCVLRPDVSTISGRGCLEMSQTHRQTDRDRDSMTEFAQWAESVKTWAKVLGCIHKKLQDLILQYITVTIGIYFAHKVL